VPADLQELFVAAVKPNICFPFEAVEWVQILFNNNIELDSEKTAVLKDAGEDFFVTAQQAVAQHGANLKAVLDELKQKLNVSGKRLFMPVRIALTGQLHGPELLQIAGLLGKDKIQQRFEAALMVARKD
jgi:nondiscriminating glutamyl-tRNA synthetase